MTNDALQLFGAAGYSRDRPLERMVRDARMFTIGGGAQILRGRCLALLRPQIRGKAALPEPALAVPRSAPHFHGCFPEGRR